MKVGGMVLAAGLSERMDGPLPKQMLPLHGSAMVAVTVRNAEASVLDRVVVVTGYRAHDIGELLGDGRAVAVENPDYRAGNMTSFRVGAAALAGCDEVVVLLADMPGVSTAMIDRIVMTWQSDQPWALASSYSDRLGHPLLLSAAAMGEAVRVQGAKGLWRFLDEAPVSSVYHQEFEGSMPTDINTRDDYERMLDTRDESG